MIATIGQCVALVTHAQARLEGRAVSLDWRNNPWFAHTAEVRFGIGEPGGVAAGDDPDAWFAMLVEGGFRRAALFVEPFDGMWDTINQTGFTRGLRLSPLTGMADGTDIVWHERPRFDQADRRWRLYRGGFRVMPGQHRVRATKAEAGAALDAALARIVEFQRTYRPGEPQWSEMFHRGRRQLQSAGLAPRTLIEMSNEDDVRDRVRPLFPAEPDFERLALVAAVDASWALGAMGWWNDWGTDDDGARMRYREATFPYYEAMFACLAAACEPSA